MKKMRFGIISLGLVLGLMAGMTSCDSKEEGNKAAPAKKEAKSAAGTLPNYRYVDLDTILSKYNLAKDYNEEMMRMQTNADNAMKRHENNLQSMATSMQNKQQNNGYLTRESFDQDQQRFAAAQQQAQREAQSLQGNMEKAAMNAQKAVNDSIQAFIKTYNEAHGYDAIFFKAATLYINPALDITDEVVEGLNARYNKVKK